MQALSSVSRSHWLTPSRAQLIPSVAAELDAVFRASGEYAALAQSKAALPAKAWRALFGAPSGAPTDRLEADPAVVARALSKAFVALDSSITETPVALMKQYEAARIAATASGHGSELGPQPAPTPGSFASILPSSARALSPEAERAAALRRQGYEALLPAISGACALLTYVDSARGDVYVACTGDSRAVAGWWDEKAKRWEVEALSEDQMGRNPKEVQR
jgi:pyruvate dehydrogenase phosphatase